MQNRRIASLALPAALATAGLLNAAEVAHAAIGEPGPERPNTNTNAPDQQDPAIADHGKPGPVCPPLANVICFDFSHPHPCPPPLANVTCFDFVVGCPPLANQTFFDFPAAPTQGPPREDQILAPALDGQVQGPELQ